MDKHNRYLPQNLRNERETLIDSLIEYRKRKGHDITVVFDGWKTGEGRSTSRSSAGYEWSIQNRRKADAVIKRIISSVKQQWIVVSSDRDIANYAWASVRSQQRRKIFSGHWREQRFRSVIVNRTTMKISVLREKGTEKAVQKR